jgi:hypothetical protein
MLAREMEHGIHWRELIFELIPETLDEVAADILASVNFEDPAEIWRIARILVNAIDFRPCSTSLLIPFAAKLWHAVPFQFALINLLKSKITNQRIHFLHCFFEIGLLSLEAIISICGLQSRLSLLWFAPQFAEVHGCRLPRDFEPLRENDWMAQRLLTANPLNPSRLAQIIRADDAEAFSAEVPCADAVVPPFQFEAIDLLDGSIRAIQYAAFFDSVHCFTNLVEQQASVESVAQFAVAGGAHRVIAFGLANAVFDPSEVAEFAVLYHRNVLFEWLLSRDELVVTNSMFISAILSDNLGALPMMVGINVDDGEPIALAAMSNQLDSFSYLLSLPTIEVDRPDSTGRTPFFYAVQNSNILMMEKILGRAQVNCTVRNRNGVFHTLLTGLF